MRILRAVAEEMGQIPARTPAPCTPAITLRHEVIGVDLNTALGVVQASKDATIIDVEPISDPLPAIDPPVTVPAVEPVEPRRIERMEAEPRRRRGVEPAGMWDTEYWYR
jgi:hypothetical protein